MYIHNIHKIFIYIKSKEGGGKLRAWNFLGY